MKRITSYGLVLAGVLSLSTGVAFAQGTKKGSGMQSAPASQPAKRKGLHDQFTGQEYGMAGCGLGSVVFADKPGMIQIVAATLNGIGYQTFAISSGTSNCGESGASAMLNQFIEVNRASLQKDMARGDGESLAALKSVMSCTNDQFGQSMQSQYSDKASSDLSADEIQALAYQACKI